jgi:hypothetical protein
LAQLNPMRFLLVPLFAALALFAAAAATRFLPLLIPAGVLVFVVGARIAYNHRGAGDAYLRAMRKNVRRGFLWPGPASQRAIDGSVMGALGTALIGIGVISLFR